MLCFLNNDTEVISAGWLEEMVSLACRDGVGAVGAMLYYPDDKCSMQVSCLVWAAWLSHAHQGLARGSPGDHGRAALTQAMSAVTAACLVVRKALFDEVGGFDETLAVAYNDVDFCLRIGARGLRNVWTPVCASCITSSPSAGETNLRSARPGFLVESQDDSRALGRAAQRGPLFQSRICRSSARTFGSAYPPRHRRRWWEN